MKNVMKDVQSSTEIRWQKKNKKKARQKDRK